jgi:hypothetical protein
MASLPIQERLLHYFIAMGAQPVDSFPNLPAGLSLLIGTEKIHVTIVKHDTFLQRGKILESILNLSSLTSSVNRVYLAAPRLLGTAIDTDVFRARGIGLLLFDDRRIDEVLTPQTVPNASLEPLKNSPDQALVDELDTLRSMYLELRGSLDRLHDELESFKGASGLGLGDPMPRPQLQILRGQPQVEATENGLPSFFTNNPWLEVLSRRGREESSPLAS